MQYLVVASDTGRAFFSVEIRPDWRDLAFRQRAVFLFEPVGVVQVGPLAAFLSIPNLAIGVLLGALVGANVAASYYGFRELGMRGLRGMQSLAGTAPLWSAARPAACPPWPS